MSRTASIVCTFALLTASSVCAQVLEVGSDGQMHTLGPVAQPQLAGAPPVARAGVMAGAVTLAAARFGLAPELLDAVARQESGYRAGAVSPKGALGVMQLMPGTARALGVDPRDPAANIMGGAAYLRQQLDRFDGRVDLALAAYNAGPGAVTRHGGVPPYRETQGYVVSNLSRLARTSLSRPPLSQTDLNEGVDP